MSKKKSFSGSTMTLKDFHGGSIPSDLSLPSAPGASVVRQPDRVGYDRPVSGGWGNTGTGKVDHHKLSRPGSAGGVRSRGFVDDTAPFLPHTAHIGRHFEEDERKPFDASSAPRRPLPAIDTLMRTPRPAQEVKQSQLQQVYDRPGSSPAAVPQHLSGGSVFPVARVSSTPQGFANGASPAPNAWGIKKEVPSVPPVETTGILSGPEAASRFAQASAMEKISSGRWQTKPATFNETSDAEVIRFSETARGNSGFHDHNAAYGGCNPEQRHNVRFNGVDRWKNDRTTEHQAFERTRSPVYAEVQERIGTLGVCSDGPRLISNDERHTGAFGHLQKGRSSPLLMHHPEERHRETQVNWQDAQLGGLQMPQQSGRFSGMQGTQQDGMFSADPQVQQQGITEISERPKLRLLPRTRPLEPAVIQVTDSLQRQQLPPIELGILERGREVHGNPQIVKPESVGSDERDGVSERPRLNLKPRRQPLGYPDDTSELERKALFGGARPRELVLKDRSVGDPPNNHEQPISNSGGRHDSQRTNAKQEIVSTLSRQRERVEAPFEQQTGRDLERQDNRVDLEKVDDERVSWRKDNWRNARESGMSLDRHPELDSWRKTLEQPKPDLSGTRHGKVASAADLAHAFSRSISETKYDARLTTQRNQVPFSRLTGNRELHAGSNPRQINGY